MLLDFGVLLLLDGRSPGSPAGPVAAASILAIVALEGIGHWAWSRGSDALPAEETQESLSR